MSIPLTGGAPEADPAETVAQIAVRCVEAVERPTFSSVHETDESVTPGGRRLRERTYRTPGPPEQGIEIVAEGSVTCPAPTDVSAVAYVYRDPQGLVPYVRHDPRYRAAKGQLASASAATRFPVGRSPFSVRLFLPTALLEVSRGVVTSYTAVVVVWDPAGEEWGRSAPYTFGVSAP